MRSQSHLTMLFRLRLLDPQPRERRVQRFGGFGAVGRGDGGRGGGGLALDEREEEGEGC